MATHSSILAWRIPCTEKPGGLQPMELQSQTQLKHLISTRACIASGHIRNPRGVFTDDTVCVRVRMCLQILRHSTLLSPRGETNYRKEGI